MIKCEFGLTILFKRWSDNPARIMYPISNLFGLQSEIYYCHYTQIHIEHSLHKDSTKTVIAHYTQIPNVIALPGKSNDKAK